MKSILLMFCLSCFMLNATIVYPHNKLCRSEFDDIIKKFKYRDRILNAIKIVESQNGKYLEGKNGEMGPYQMKKIVIDDVNRILGRNVYKYNDAYNEQKARKICWFYMEYWSRKAGYYNEEAMVRIWNGGPKGYKKESTLKYWEKVRKVLNGHD